MFIVQLELSMFKQIKCLVKLMGLQSYLISIIHPSPTTLMVKSTYAHYQATSWQQYLNYMIHKVFTHSTLLIYLLNNYNWLEWFRKIGSQHKGYTVQNTICI